MVPIRNRDKDVIGSRRTIRKLRLTATPNARRMAAECKMMQAIGSADSDKPDPDPNCALDLTCSEFSMKELQKGVHTGMEALSSSMCFNALLTIDKNTNRV